MKDWYTQNKLFSMVCRRTADASYVRWHTSMLQKLRSRRTLSHDDQFFVLLVFYELNAEVHEKQENGQETQATDARNRTARLCGRSPSTVGKINRDYPRHFRSTTTSANSQLNSALLANTERTTRHKSKRIPDDDDDENSFLIDDFIGMKRCNIVAFWVTWSIVDGRHGFRAL